GPAGGRRRARPGSRTVARAHVLPRTVDGLARARRDRRVAPELPHAQARPRRSHVPQEADGLMKIVFEEMGEVFVGAGRPASTTAQHSPRPRRAHRGDPASTLEATCPETAGPLPRI